MSVRWPSPFDRAQLPAPLGITDSEFNWYIFEGAGRGTDGPRRVAGLVSIHRTGPRVRRVSFAPRLVTGRDLPAPLRGLVPSWLPILSPVNVESDDRPLFMVALYDLDATDPRPIQIEHEIEHADLDLATFSATARDGRLRLDQRDGTVIAADCERFSLELQVHARKPGVVFGAGSPRIRHGRIETSYFQRPRLDLTGTIRIGDDTIREFTGQGVQDRQWLQVTSPNLKWMWPHLRLPGDRELTGYVIRDSSPGRHADADAGDELGRGGWLIEPDGTVRALPRFDVRALAHVDTERGRVPTRFAVTAPELDLRLVIDHLVAAPYLRMRAFGDVLDAGLHEGPIRVEGHPDIHGWVEVMNAATVRLARGR